MKPRQSTAAPVAADAHRCTGCGACLTVCPKDILAVETGKIVVRDGACMQCGHCAAACPAGALRVSTLDPALLQFATFSADRRWLPHGRFDTARLVNLMGSRRSCRNFSARPVDRPLLEDLVRVGITAPSGTNCQPWTFSILPDRPAVERLGRRVGDVFRRMNRLAATPWLRSLLRLVGRPQLADYHREYYPAVRAALAAWDRGEADMLFHGAPAVIVVAARNDASCPAEDALLAAGNMLLAAHAMGLGTCLIGFVIAAMRRDRGIARMLAIPDGETAHAVIAVGWPREAYRAVAGRKPVTVRYPDLSAR